VITYAYLLSGRGPAPDARFTTTDPGAVRAQMRAIGARRFECVAISIQPPVVRRPYFWEARP
jgi:hypothetical protein